MKLFKYQNGKKGKSVAMFFICGFFLLASQSRAIQMQDIQELKINSLPAYNTLHHTKKGFKYLWPAKTKRPALKTAGWLLGYIFKSGEKPPSKIPFTNINPEFIRTANNKVDIFWTGHSTVLIKTEGQFIITDPVFSRRVSPVSFIGPKRLVDLPVKLSEIPRIDIVLISHDHYDHLDKNSIIEINRRFSPLFLVPLKIKKILNSWGINKVYELDWWQYTEYNGMMYYCTPARHFSTREGIQNRNLFAGWYIKSLSNNMKIYFAGDTGYAPFFNDIRKNIGSPDIALLPVGAYDPRWFMSEVHMDPEEALKAFLDLGAEYFIGIHWGTFRVTSEPTLEPLALVPQIASKMGLPPGRIIMLPVGGHFYR